MKSKFLFFFLIIAVAVNLTAQETEISIKAIEKLSSYLANGCVFNTGGEKEDLLFLKAVTNDISFIQNQNSDEIKILKNDNVGKYLFSDYSERLLFHVKGIDIWSNTVIEVYISIDKYGVSDSQKKSPWPENNLFPSGSLFYNSRLYGMTLTNPKLTDEWKYYSIIQPSNVSKTIDILGYRITVSDEGIRFWIYLRNRTGKDIAGFKGYVELLDKFKEPISYGGGDNIFGFSSSETIFEAGKTSSIGPWVIRLAKGTRMLKPHINKVFFSDGTKLEFK